MIAIGSDHAGFEMKTVVLNYLVEKGCTYKDFGTHDPDTSVDYPDFGRDVALAVKSGECDKGIVICGTGIGISIAANKIPGIRAALCTDTYMARMSREHNNANILALGGRVTGSGLAVEIVKVWLESEFKADRHKKRVDKISALEED